MDKVKVFFVRYCQWLALGLAAAFLLWMVYANVLEKPVSVPVGQNKPGVLPGDVNAEVWSGDGPGAKLESAVTSTAKYGAFPQTPDFHERIEKAFLPQEEVAWANPIFPVPAPVKYPDAGGQEQAPKATFVTGLPVLPPLGELTFSAGHSNVTITPPNAPAPAGQPGLVAAVDKNWITVLGKLPMDSLSKSFTAANVPATFFNTQVLRVVLVRQERTPAGAWDPETVVSPLAIYPTDALPPADATADVQSTATAEAAKNVQILLQPAFYTIVNGDKWYVPGTENPNVVVTQVVTEVVPPTPVTPKVKPVTPKTPVVPPRTAGGTTGGTPGTGGKSSGGKSGGTGKHSIDTSAGSRDSFYYGGGGGGYGGDVPIPPQRPPTGNNGASPLPGDPAQPNPTDPNPATGTPPPAMTTAKFSPANSPDITVWAHDDTVEPGKTYRYALKYYLLNPVAGSKNLCKPESLADIFWIESPLSDWSVPIRVDPDTNFYATAISGREGMKFDVFKWHNGLWQMETADVHPGDMIGNLDPRTKTDFTTGWTLVDIRLDPAGNDSNRIILLANNNGTVVRKELKLDKASPKYQDLLKQANKAAAPGGAVPPPAPAAAPAQ